MAVNVKDVRSVLLGARADDQIWNGDAMASGCSQLALGRLGGGQGRMVNSQVSIGLQVSFQRDVVIARTRAAEDLDFGDGADAELPVLDQLRPAPRPGGLVK